MNLTERDRKIMIIIAPLVLVLAYWFLVLSPQRKESATAAQTLTKQEKRRDAAQANLEQLQRSKSSFGSDYAQLVKLGKAIPSSVDMPTLIVQLDSAAKGTGIKFSKIAAGQPLEPGSAPSAPPAGGSGGGAQTGPGKAAQNASGGAQTANNATQSKEQAAQKSGAAPADAQTSSSPKSGGLPVGGGQTGGGGSSAAASACGAGLDCVPLEFEFSGGFFDLADFFHRMKRFVRVANERLDVSGRLLTVDALKFSSEGSSFPNLKAEVKATVYLSPKSEGETAGATPAGPAQTQPAGSQAPASSSAPPTAAVTP